MPVISPNFFLITSEVFTVSDSMVFCRGGKKEQKSKMYLEHKKEVRYRVYLAQFSVSNCGFLEYKTFHNTDHPSVFNGNPNVGIV